MALGGDFLVQASPAPSDDDARRLLRFVQHADREALSSLWLSHVDEAWRLARWICGERAENAVQEAAVDLLRYAGSWRDRGPGSARGWLLTVVANAARRQRRREVPFWQPLHEVGVRPALDGTPTDSEHWEQLQAALLQLARPYRRAIELRYLVGLDFAAVAVALGVPERTARTRVVRGLEELRQRLGVAPAGGTHAALVFMTTVKPLTPPAEMGSLVAAAGAVAAAKPVAALAIAVMTLLLITGAFTWRLPATSGSSHVTVPEPAPVAAVATEVPAPAPAWLELRRAPWPNWPLWYHPQTMARWVAAAVRREPGAPQIVAAGLLPYATRAPLTPDGWPVPADQDPTLREQLDAWSRASGGRWDVQGGTLRCWLPLSAAERAALLRDLEGTQDIAGAWAARRLLNDGDPEAAAAALTTAGRGGPATERVIDTLAEVMQRELNSFAPPLLNSFGWWRQDAGLKTGLNALLARSVPAERRPLLLAIAGRIGLESFEKELIAAATPAGQQRVLLLFGLAHLTTPGAVAWFDERCAAKDEDVIRCLPSARQPALAGAALRALAAQPGDLGMLARQAVVACVSAEPNSQAHALPVSLSLAKDGAPPAEGRDDVDFVVMDLLLTLRTGTDQQRDDIAARFLKADFSPPQLRSHPLFLSELIDRPAAKDLLIQAVGASSIGLISLEGVYRPGSSAWDPLASPSWLAAAPLAVRSEYVQAIRTAFAKRAGVLAPTLACAAGLGDPLARETLLAFRPTNWNDAVAWSAALTFWYDPAGLRALQEFTANPGLAPDLRQGVPRGSQCFGYDRRGGASAPFWDYVHGLLAPAEHRWLRSDAAGVLGAAGVAAEPALVAWQDMATTDSDGRVAGMAGILTMDPPAFLQRSRYLSLLRQAAKGQPGRARDEIIRWNAANKLADALRANPELLPELLRLTTDPHPVVRRRALMALAAVPSGVVPALSAALEQVCQRGLEDPSPLVRRVVGAILTARREPDLSALRAHAIALMGEIKSGRDDPNGWAEYYKDPTPAGLAPSDLPGLPVAVAAATPGRNECHWSMDGNERIYAAQITVGEPHGLGNPVIVRVTRSDGGKPVEINDAWGYRSASGALHIDTALLRGDIRPEIPCLALDPDGTVRCLEPDSGKSGRGHVGPLPVESKESGF